MQMDAQDGRGRAGGAGYRVGEWIVDPAAHRIVGRGGETRVEPKVMQVLGVLAERPGAVVGRDELLARVWTDQVVVDFALSRAISQLRKAFGDDPRAPRVIETISKSGYRLLLPVAPVGPGGMDGAAAGDASGDASPEPPVLHVAGGASAPARRPARRWLGPALLVGVGLVLGSMTFALLRPAAPARLPRRPLTSYPGIEGMPALSPDGSMLAFVWHGEAGGGADVYVKLLAEETPLRLTLDPADDVSPAWSPDGRHVAFLRRTRGAGCAVYVTPVVGGAERRVGTCSPRAGGLAWAPDADRLAVAVADSTASHAALALLDLRTGAVQPLTTPSPRHADDLPTFSPDGRRLAFVRRTRGGQGTLYTMPAGGGTPVALLDEPAAVAGLGWTPDGRDLVFSSDRDGTYQLWRLPAGGGRPAWMAEVGAYDPGGVAFSRRTPAFAYVEWAYDTNVWAFDGAAPPGPGAAPRRLLASTRWDQDAAPSPDGRRVAFVSDRGGRSQLWVAAADGRAPVALTAAGAPVPRSPRWSPDGRWVAYAAAGTGGGLYVVDAGGGTPRRLSPEGWNVAAPAWSADGRTLSFGAARAGGWERWRVPASGGAPVQGTTTGAYAAVEVTDDTAPGGAFLYFTRADHPGLWRRPLAGGDETQVVADLQPMDRESWAVAAGGVFYVARGGDGATLRFHPFGGGDAVDVARLPHEVPAFAAALAATPDGRRVLVTQADQVEGDIVLVGAER